MLENPIYNYKFYSIIIILLFGISLINIINKYYFLFYFINSEYCYSNYNSSISNITISTLQFNRDRLIIDLSNRKCTDSCTLWYNLNLAERYIFLMNTAYFSSNDSRIYPPEFNNKETLLDHTISLYSINGPNGYNLGGFNYNRIYIGVDNLAKCIMRNISIINPNNEKYYNQWIKSDDIAGPHYPFNEREMIYWYRDWYDYESNGPQWHHWNNDNNFNQNSINTRLGVCGNTDKSLIEMTIAFDFFHNSNPLGNYSNKGFGWEIINKYLKFNSNWDYIPTGCSISIPNNNNIYGGTFIGMGPQLNNKNGECSNPIIGKC